MLFLWFEVWLKICFLQRMCIKSINCNKLKSCDSAFRKIIPSTIRSYFAAIVQSTAARPTGYISSNAQGLGKTFGVHLEQSPQRLLSLSEQSPHREAPRVLRCRDCSFLLVAAKIALRLRKDRRGRKLQPMFRIKGAKPLCMPYDYRFMYFPMVDHMLISFPGNRPATRTRIS